MPVLVFGTHNRKKAAELVDLLCGIDVTLRTLADFDDAIEVDESGSTFAENAAAKATAQARHLGQWVLGDDSGLVVDALDGSPGIYSARYAGEKATDADNRRKLLEALVDVRQIERRTAHFACHLALADPRGNVRLTSAGRCSGRIRFEASGSGGFGYDPLFEVVEYHRTFGELSPAVKACLSHRARAMGALVPQLVALLASGAWQADD
ncbi:MAG: RdgB/HAM1 family non-canonical purine NTP pyrophosphatase [Planctomycetota bacterium]|nr:MAG: RdgB/HAM1 family non-canonical purine NTP pyrophosphatase [Planctomycetota bacterium]